MMACLLLTIIVSKVADIDANWSAWSCLDVSWPVDVSDSVANKALAQSFRNWLSAWQDDCGRKSLHGPAPRVIGGVSDNFNWIMRDFMTAIEIGKIYRPMGEWHWAHTSNENKQNCTLGLTSVDCFFEPISVCQLGSPRLNVSAIDQIYKELAFPARDSCTIASTLRKPIQWVHNHMVNYVFRPNARLQQRIDGIRSQLTAAMSNTSCGYNASDGQQELGESICVHVRAGKPDNGRHVSNLDKIMEYVDSIVASTQGRVRVVYLSSNLIHEIIVSKQHMENRYPPSQRHHNYSYSYVVPTHMAYGEDVHMETEHLLRGGQYDRHELVLEFLADVEIFASCDYFIGSVSNVYQLVTALRTARRSLNGPRHSAAAGIGWGYEYNSSCHVSKEERLICEGSEDAKSFWRANIGGYDSPNSTFIIR